MRVKICTMYNAGAWYMRNYLRGRTCQVLAKHTIQVAEHTYSTSYFVLHPITKKPGYWINTKDCIKIGYGPVPTWEEFLTCNQYGYSNC